MDYDKINQASKHQWQWKVEYIPDRRRKLYVIAKHLYYGVTFFYCSSIGELHNMFQSQTELSRQQYEQRIWDEYRPDPQELDIEAQELELID